MTRGGPGMGRVTKEPCRHCKTNRGFYGRGLCMKCHKNPAVRGLYKGVLPTPEPDGGLDTAEAVERRVAEQMRRLPAWWSDDTRMIERMERRGDVRGHKVLVVRNLRFVNG